LIHFYKRFISQKATKMSEAKIDGMFMENLEEWILEEQKVVTYKYLSRALKVHVNVAKQMLFNFIEEQRKKDTELGIVYLISGNLAPLEDGVSKLKVVLVEDKSVEKELKKFQTVLSRHVYSVQKAAKVTSTGLFATDQVSLKEDVFIANSQSAIKNKAAVPRPNYQVIKKEAVPKKEIKPEVKKEPKVEVKQEPSTIESAFSKTKKKSPEKDTSAKKPVSAGKKPSNIASMFAKQAAKPKVKTEALTSSTSPGKENLENAQIEDRKAEEKKVETKESPKPVSAGKKSAATTAKKSANKEKKSAKKDTKKRKRIAVASDSESEEEEEKAAEAEEEEEAPPQARIIESEDEEEIPSTPQPSQSSGPGRRKVRKEVDKTYMDEKGYMVTKKEFVYESEEEPEAEAKPEVKKIEPKMEKAAPAAKKPKLMAAGNTKQPGIMSFFKKK